MPAIPALGRLRQEYFKFEANLGYTERLSQKIKNRLQLPYFRMFCTAAVIKTVAQRKMYIQMK
jgi:hypothetical protein